MGRSLGTPIGYKRTTTNGRGQETTETTAEPMKMHSNTDRKKAIKRICICGNNHESINYYGEIIRILHQKYTKKSEIKDQYPRDKVKYAR